MDREDLGRAEQVATRGIGRSMGRMVLRLLRLGALLRGFASTTRSRSNQLDVKQIITSRP
jgi:hypothetical protein